MQQRKLEPLEGHPKYQKASRAGPAMPRLGLPLRLPKRLLQLPAGCADRPLAAWRRVQIKDLNSGTFGFVQLALDRTTGRNVAIKFIERGDKVGWWGGRGRGVPNTESSTGPSRSWEKQKYRV